MVLLFERKALKMKKTIIGALIMCAVVFGIMYLVFGSTGYGRYNGTWLTEDKSEQYTFGSDKQNDIGTYTISTKSVVGYKEAESGTYYIDKEKGLRFVMISSDGKTKSYVVEDDNPKVSITLKYGEEEIVLYPQK